MYRLPGGLKRSGGRERASAIRIFAASPPRVHPGSTSVNTGGSTRRRRKLTAAHYASQGDSYSGRFLLRVRPAARHPAYGAWESVIYDEAPVPAERGYALAASGGSA